MHIENYTEEKTKCINFNHNLRKNSGNGLNEHFRIQRESKRHLRRCHKADESESQAKKGIRRMPRRFESKKGAISCDKPRGVASRLRSVDT